MFNDEQLALLTAVDFFIEKMYEKLMAKYDEGYRGWLDPKNAESFAARLSENLDRKDWVDVACFAMFLALNEDKEIHEKLEAHCRTTKRLIIDKETN